MPKVRDIIAEIEANGWVFSNQEGSHRHYKHPMKPGKVTINGQLGEEISADLYHKILRQAGLRRRPRGKR